MGINLCGGLMSGYFSIFFGAMLHLWAMGAGAVTVHMIGDSTMSIKDPKDHPETGWGQALALLAKSPITVKNYAVNGRSTKSFVSEGRWAAAKEAFEPGDFLIIQFGHNDQKRKDPNRYTQPFGSYTENLSQFIQQARDAKVQPILATSIVRRKFTEAGVLKDTHKDYLLAVRHLAKAQQVPLVDMEALTRQMVEAAGVEGSIAFYVHGAPGELPNYPGGVKDNTHLSEKGALDVAHLFIAALRSKQYPLGEFFTLKGK